MLAYSHSVIVHPSPAELTLNVVLHALSDPQRRAIFTQITLSGRITCAEVAPELPRSTVSVHLKRLREAGLIRQERQGQLIANEERSDGARERFGALVDAVFAQCPDHSESDA